MSYHTTLVTFDRCGERRPATSSTGGAMTQLVASYNLRRLVPVALLVSMAKWMSPLVAR